MEMQQCIICAFLSYTKLPATNSYCALHNNALKVNLCRRERQNTLSSSYRVHDISVRS